MSAMTKYIPNIVGALLGFLFVFSGAAYLFNMVPMPEIPPESPIGIFMKLFGDSGYMTFVKILEVVGGVLIAIPKLRSLGLLVLGPILLNIIAFHAFIAKEGLFSGMLIVIVIATLYLLWSERKRFAGLVR